MSGTIDQPTPSAPAPAAAKQQESILVAQDLHKHYRAVKAVDGVSLSLTPGRTLGFLGPNGAGKSTTMKMLCGQVVPDSGTVVIDGHDLAAAPLAGRRAIGYLPQRLPLYPEMTPRSYLHHIARLKGIRSGERRREVHDCLHACAIEPVADRAIDKLSGGNRQRVGLAQALLGSPPILILDEPTAGLDPAQTANFRDLLRGLGEKHAVLVSTHIMGEVEACCDDVLIVQDGRVLLATSVADFTARAREVGRLRIRVRADAADALAAALADTDWAEVDEQAGDTLLVTAVAERRGELVHLAEHHGGLAEITDERRSLEELFRDLIAGRS